MPLNFFYLVAIFICFLQAFLSQIQKINIGYYLLKFISVKRSYLRTPNCLPIFIKAAIALSKWCC